MVRGFTAEIRKCCGAIVMAWAIALLPHACYVVVLVRSRFPLVSDRSLLFLRTVQLVLLRLSANRTCQHVVLVVRGGKVVCKQGVMLY